MGLRDLARKSLGLFVELPDTTVSEGGEGEQALRGKSLSELMAELDESGAPRATFDAPPSSAVQDGQVNFAAIYQEAGVAPLAFTAEQTLDLIRALPAELPLSTKRQTLDVSLNTLGRAMNVSKEQVALDAARKLDALAAFEEAARNQRDQAVSATHARIQELQAQIEEERRKAGEAEAGYQVMLAQCEAQGDLLDQVQEFLTLDQAPPIASQASPAGTTGWSGGQR